MRILPAKNGRKREKMRKAVRSLTSKGQLQVAALALDQYKSTLTFYVQTYDATAASLKGLVVKRKKAFYDRFM